MKLIAIAAYVAAGMFNEGTTSLNILYSIGTITYVILCHDEGYRA